MRAPARPYVIAGAALVATSLIAVTPIAPRLPEMPVTSLATRLLSGDSILNVPINLLYDLANIPYNEVQALDTVAGSLFFGGNWWVPSSTNIWGIDPGDTTHVALLTDLVAPFPALDGGVGGLQYQLDGLLAAELPVSASCATETCAPIVPPDVITGSTGLDRYIGFFETLTGQQPFGLFDNWFTVPLSTLASGYTFSPANDPGVIDPSGPANVDPAFGFTNGGSNPFIGGTVVDPTTGQNDMPWNGLTYQLNLLQPLENFWNSLLAAPSTSGLMGTGIEIPTLTEITQALQAVAAATVVAFDPWATGSPFCYAECANPPFGTIPQIVQALDPTNSNPMIQAWLADTAAGTANNGTSTQAQDAIDLLQTGLFNLTPAELDQALAQLDSINPEMGQLAVNAGILTDPGYLAEGPAQLGGYNPNLVPGDLLAMLTGSAASAGTTDFSTLLPGLDPTAWSAELSTLLASFDPATLSADLSGLLANFGATLAPDLATMLPSNLLSLF